MLKKHGFFAPTTTEVTVVGTPSMLNFMMDNLMNKLPASTIISFQDVQTLEDLMAISSNQPHMFPETIPVVILTPEQKSHPFTLSREYPHLCMEGTKWSKQLDAMHKFKTKPPITPTAR